MGRGEGGDPLPAVAVNMSSVNLTELRLNVVARSEHVALGGMMPSMNLTELILDVVVRSEHVALGDMGRGACSGTHSSDWADDGSVV